MTKRMLIMLGFILVLVAGLAFGFYLHIQKLIASSPKPGPQTVSAIEIKSLEWRPQLNAVGNLSPVKGVDISSEISGLVREVLFHSGDVVKAGAPLIQLNADAEMAQLKTAEASAELAEVVFQRDKAQFAAQAISQAQLDFDAADLKMKKAQMALQKANLEKKTIRAPFAGKLGITTVVAGQYLNPGDKIVTLQSLNPIFVDFYQPQQKVSLLKLNQSVELSVDAFPDQIHKGKITTLNPKVDPASRNIQIQATFSNPKLELLPGMFTNVRVNVGDVQRYLTLPQTAVTFNPYGSTVFIIKDDDKPSADGKVQHLAQQVFVTTGETRGDQIAIIKGLKEGQTVVTSGQLKLKNGTPVVIDNSVSPDNNPNPTPQE